LSPRPSLHRSQIPQKHAATGFVMRHMRIFGPHIGAGTESLYRSQYSHRDNPLWITRTINPDPCFYWRWQGTTGLFFLLAEFTARYSQCCEHSEALSLKPQAYLIKTYIAYIRQNMQQNLNSWCISKSSGLILRLAIVAPCSVVTVMIHHEFNTKHFFFWAWNPRSRHSTAHICSKCITSEPNLFQWQVPTCLNIISWKQSAGHS